MKKKFVIHFVKKIEEAVPPENFVNGKSVLRGRAENAYALPTAKHLEVTCQAPCIEELQSLEENPSEGLTLKQGKISKGKINSQQKTKAHKKKIVKSIYQ